MSFATFIFGMITGAALVAWHCAKAQERTSREATELAQSIQRQLAKDAKRARGLSS